MPIYAGTDATTRVTFTTPGIAEPVDPTTVTLKYRIGNSDVTTWTFGVTGDINKEATGVYSAVIDTTRNAGRLTVEWVGTEACAAVGVGTDLVYAAPLD